MKRHNYSFDLGIPDYSITSKEKIINSNNANWLLIIILINIILETIFIWTLLDPFSNFIIIFLTILTIYSQISLEENSNSYENNKAKKLQSYFFYYFCALIISIIIKLIFIILKRENFNFYSKDLSIRYITILISFFFIMRILLTFLFKKFVTNKFNKEINE